MTNGLKYVCEGLSGIIRRSHFWAVTQTRVGQCWRSFFIDFVKYAVEIIFDDDSRIVKLEMYFCPLGIDFLLR